MITIAATPHPLSWIDNHPSFRVECSGILSGGRRSVLMLRFAHTALLYNFSIRVDGHTLTYQRYVSPSTHPYRFYDLSELVSKIESNYYIADTYTVTSSTLSTYDTITLTSKSVAKHDLALVSRSAYVSVASEDAGEDMVSLANYGVVARFELEDGTLTPWCRYTPVNGTVAIYTDQLRGFFGDPTLPLGATPAAQRLNATLCYRLQIAESYGEPPVMQLVTSTGWLLLAEGEVQQLFAASDLPDWADALPSKTLSYEGVRPRIIGTDTRRTYDLRAGQPCYLYVLLNDTSSSPSASTEVTISVTYRSAGVSHTDTHDTSIDNGAISRIDVGPAALSLPDDVSSYSVSITDASSACIFAARYVLRPAIYRGQEFLLMDKYGLLRHVVAGSMAISSVSEGDEATFASGKKTHVIVTREQNYSVTTPNLRRHEAAVVAESLASRHAYVKANGQWCPITIAPGTVTSWDDDADMVRISWSYAYVDNQRSNLAAALLQVNNINYGEDIDYEEDLTYNE